MKVYTKTGDWGETSLIGGERVSKCDPRVEAYGTVDELMAFTALLADKLRDTAALADFGVDLRRILSDLMTLSAILAVGEGGTAPALASHETLFLETRIDVMQSQVPEIQRFTLPGGHKDVSLCHVCRTVCRRAERAALRATQPDQFDLSAAESAVAALAFLNRLSDYFYLLGRVLTARLHVEEILWEPTGE